nr:MAG TPA: hypothetical protein [Caudoviricetes sp.]
MRNFNTRGGRKIENIRLQGPEEPMWKPGERGAGAAENQSSGPCRPVAGCGNHDGAGQREPN